MPIQRTFLGWDEHPLASGCARLIEQFARRGGDVPALDLSAVTVVLPSSRAERRLLELLLDEGERRSLPLVPPVRRTVGQLPELLYTPLRPLATELQQRLAWIGALEKMSAGERQALVPHLAARPSLGELLGLADRLSSLWRDELAPYCLTFSDAAERGKSLFADAECRRWEALQAVFERALAALHQAGCGEREHERLAALSEKRCSFDGALVLFAAADLKPLACRMLECAEPKIEVYCAAPEEHSSGFDKLGCLDTNFWSSRRLDIPEKRVVFADGPAEQAAAVVRAAAFEKGPLASDELTVGLCDSALLPFVEQRMNVEGVVVRDPQGRTAAHTAPGLLLRASAGFLKQPSFAQFAALVRQPDFETALHAVLAETEAVVPPEGYLPLLDEFHVNHLPSALPSSFSAFGERYRLLDAVRVTSEELLEPLCGLRAPIGEWAGRVAGFLREVFGSRSVSRTAHADRALLESLECILAVAEELHDSAEQRSAESEEALELLLHLLQARRIAPDGPEEAVEVLGWLELPLDDAPVLIVAGANEGSLPASVTSDAFLPDSLRSLLGILDNRHRLARDVYAAAVLDAVRKPVFVAGRRDAQGEPLLLSRVLLAGDVQERCERILRFTRENEQRDEPAALDSLLGALSPARGAGQYELRGPQSVQPPERARVTSLRDYLCCPYLYYLKHVLNLATLDDRDREMDALRFGTLAHEVLAEFGADETASVLQDAGEIAGVLSELLDMRVRQVFGAWPHAAVHLQHEQLRSRLGVFAGWQAGWAAKGWRIERVETALTPEQGRVALSSGGWFTLSGRIDRIDFNERDGRRALFDYKTSEGGGLPGSQHRKDDGTWLDLQLPAYRMALTEGGASPEVGYIALAKDAARSGGRMLEESCEWFAEAEEEIRRTAECINQGEFWPPKPWNWRDGDRETFGMHAALLQERFQA